MSFNTLIAQEKGIKIFNAQIGKEILIKENKRIKIEKSDGIMLAGKFKVLDSTTILLNNEQIKLSEIEKIKKSPLLISILTTGILCYFGAGLAGASLVLYAFSGKAASFLLTIPAAGLIYGGIKLPNIFKGYKTTKNWQYQIINTSQ